MPPKPKRNNSAGSSSSATNLNQLTCDGCSDILQKKEALNCSVCKVWLHRYCAGVPTSRFSDIAQSFVCIPCSLIANNSVVAELKNEVAALKSEVVQLRSALEIVNKKLEDTASAQNKREREEWSTVVKRNTRRNDRRVQSSLTSSGSGNRSDRAAAGSGDNPSASSARRPRSVEEQPPRVVVPGVRRVRGTFKHTPAGAVASTLKKLTTTGDRPTIKRVFRRGTVDGRDRWWFHLLGEEELLKQLEGEWESVLLQTSWKLEPCSKPARPEKSTDSECTSPTDPEATAPSSEQSNAPLAVHTTIANSQSETVTPPLPDPESAPESEDNGELVINSQNPNPTNDSESDNFLLVEGENQTQSN